MEFHPVDVSIRNSTKRYKDIFEFKTNYISDELYTITVERKDLDQGWGQHLKLICTYPNEQNQFVKVGSSVTRQKTVEVRSQCEIQKIVIQDSSIPRLVFQTWKSREFHPSLLIGPTSWKNRNPEYTYHFYDDQDILEFIHANYGKDILKAYLTLTVPKARVDFWRLLIVYKYGGFYADIDTMNRLPLRECLHENDVLVVLKNQDSKKIDHCVFGAVADHPLIGQLIDNITERVLNGETINDFKTYDNLFGNNNWTRFIKEYLDVETTRVTQKQDGDATASQDADSNTDQDPTEILNTVVGNLGIHMVNMNELVYHERASHSTKWQKNFKYNPCIYQYLQDIRLMKEEFYQDKASVQKQIKQLEIDQAADDETEANGVKSSNVEASLVESRTVATGTGESIFDLADPED